MSKIEPSTRRVVVEETIAEPKDFEQVLKTTTKTNKQTTRTLSRFSKQQQKRIKKRGQTRFSKQQQKQSSITTRTNNVLKTKQIDKHNNEDKQMIRQKTLSP